MYWNDGRGWFPCTPPGLYREPDEPETRPKNKRTKGYPTEPLEPDLDLIPNSVQVSIPTQPSESPSPSDNPSTDTDRSNIVAENSLNDLPESAGSSSTEN